MKVRKDAISCCSHKEVAKGKRVPPIKLTLPSESESDLYPTPPPPHSFSMPNNSLFGMPSPENRSHVPLSIFVL